MKALTLYTILLSLAFLSCKKDKNNNSYLAISTCKSYILNTQQVNVCFDNVISDSRCPEDVVCVWEGAAIVALKVTMSAESHTIQLSTLLRGSLQLIPADTVINNVKIELLDLTPYPCVNCPAHSTGNYKVKLKLSEL